MIYDYGCIYYQLNRITLRRISQNNNGILTSKTILMFSCALSCLGCPTNILIMPWNEVMSVHLVKGRAFADCKQIVVSQPKKARGFSHLSGGTRRDAWGTDENGDA